MIGLVWAIFGFFFAEGGFFVLFVALFWFLLHFVIDCVGCYGIGVAFKMVMVGAGGEEVLRGEFSFVSTFV